MRKNIKSKDNLSRTEKIVLYWGKKKGKKYAEINFPVEYKKVKYLL